MLPWLLVAQLAAADSTYSSRALRAFVGEAAHRNREAPAGLQSYRATVESEIAIVARRPEGMEGAVSIEQVQNEVRWRRPGDFEQRVVGYRSQSIGFQFASLTFLRQPWAVPLLYGNRISLLVGRDTSRAQRMRASRRRVTAVHPLAEDRDQVYRFSGGDTVVTMRAGGRALPIVRVTVTPRTDAPPRTVAFRGELDIDATRHALVRMRGYFVTIARPEGITQRALAVGGFEAIAFVELENGEFEGRYWLPTYQRFEAQAAWTSTSDARSIFRILSRFRRMQPNDTVVTSTVDTLVAMPWRLSYAPADSLATFTDWPSDLGALSAGARGGDFDDIAPDAWRPTGAPVLRWRVVRVSDAAHVNRIEGVFTGWGVEERWRDRAPGLVLRANAGYAWSERAVRGRAQAEWSAKPWSLGVRVGRSLDLTNDFRTAFDSGSTISSLFTVDNFDYVDRRLAAIGVSRRLDRWQGIVRLETGPASDRHVVRHLARGAFRGDSGFRENRFARAGSYWRTWAAAEWHPDVSAEFMRTGVGAVVTAEHAAGGLGYLRVDSRLTMRENRGPLTLAARLDIGMVSGDSLPPQQLFELGRNQGLLGFSYKEFVGTHAAVARSLAMARLPFGQGPVRVGRWFLPSPSPAVAVGAQAAWSAVRGAGAMAAVEELWLPLRHPTQGIRTSVTVGLRLFGGALGIGVARPVDRRASWRLRVDAGQVL